MKTEHKHRLLLDSAFAGRNGFKTLFCERGISPTESQAVLKMGINSCLYCVSSGAIRACILEHPCMGCEVTHRGKYVQLSQVLIHCKAQSESALVQGLCSPCKEQDQWSRVPCPRHRVGRKQHADLGERHSMSPATHPGFSSAEWTQQPLSYLGRSRVRCSSPEPSLSRSKALMMLPQREGCDHSGGRKFLLLVLIPVVLRCHCLSGRCCFAPPPALWV